MKKRFRQQSAAFNKYHAPTLLIEDKQISSLLQHTRECQEIKRDDRASSNLLNKQDFCKLAPFPFSGTEENNLVYPSD